MNSFLSVLVIASLSIATNADNQSFVIDSANTRAWNRPQPAQKIYGNTYYVGTAGLSSILIKTEAGLILFDGDLVQSVPLIEARDPLMNGTVIPLKVTLQPVPLAAGLLMRIAVTSGLPA